MTSPVDALRSALEAYARDEARERLWRWRGAREASPAAEVVERHRWLASQAALDALGEAVDLGLVSEAERGALRAHLARAAAAAPLAAARDALGALASRRAELEGESTTVREAAGAMVACDDPRRRDRLARALVRSVEEVLPRLVDARAAADEALSAVLGGTASDPDAGPDADVLDGHAAALLDRTEDAAGEAVHAVLSTAGRVGAPGWADLARALRQPALDGLAPRRGRWRRLASGIAGLGFDRELSARVRVEAHHGGLDPRARIAVPDVPTDVRVAESPLELGLCSELSAADVLGRALGAALASPGLPVELRRPASGTASRAIGTLLAQLQADPVYLRRARDLGAADRERVGRHAGRIVLFELRLHAAAWLASREASTSRARAEAAAARLRDALGVEVPEALAALVAAAPAVTGPMLRGRLAGLAAAAALRDRYDEDWFANPRADEPLRAVAARAGAVSAERWCTDELGVDLAPAAAARLIEIAA